MVFEFGKCTVDLLLVTVLSVYILFVSENLYGLARILQQVVWRDVCAERAWDGCAGWEKQSSAHNPLRA